MFVRLYSSKYPVYTIQPIVDRVDNRFDKPVVKPI